MKNPEPNQYPFGGQAVPRRELGVNPLLNMVYRW